MSGETEVAAIEPGEPFTIEYGRQGKTLEVIALTGKQRRDCLRVMGKVQEASDSGSFSAVADAMDLLVEQVKVCSPSIPDDELDRLDDDGLGEIIVKTLGKLSIGAEQAKKSV